MHIGLFAPYDLARPGGIATHIRAQAKALRSLGHTVQVHGPASAPLDDGEISLAGAVALTLGGTTSGAGLDPRSLWRLSRVLGARRFDIVHVHEPLMPVVPWGAIWLARSPVVATFHVHREHGHRFYPIAKPILAPIVRRINRRLAVSPSAMRTVADHFPGAYEIVPNGIDVQRFQLRAARPEALERGLRHVLFVGRLEKRKGVDHLVRAMASAQRRQPRTRLVIVGDGPERAALERIAVTAAIDTLFLPTVPDEELPAFYQWADVACSPATGGESFGIVLLEALACGTPVVATRIEGYESVIGSADCGRLVPPGAPDALAAAIAELLDDEDARRACGARGLQLAQQYDWIVIGRRLQTIYEETLDSRSGRVR